MLFTQKDILMLLTGIVFVVLIPTIINWILTFIPSFMRSVVRMVKHKSIIYPDELLGPSDLDKGTLDKGTLGTRTFVDRWFGNDTFYNR